MNSRKNTGWRAPSFLFAVAVMLSLTLCGCTQQPQEQNESEQAAAETNHTSNESLEESETPSSVFNTENSGASSTTGEGDTMNITVNGVNLTATLEDNVAADALASRLPFEVPMDNLYSREMCYHLQNELPTDSVANQGYEVGDIVYWPPRRSLVILYKQNGEHFSYQKLGHINEDLTGLFEGTGTTNVVFS